MDDSHTDQPTHSFDLLKVCRWLDNCEQLLIPGGCGTCEFTHQRIRNSGCHARAQVQQVLKPRVLRGGKAISPGKPPWKSAESFLAELGHRKSLRGSPEPYTINRQRLAALPPDIAKALEWGWQMGPVSGDSRWAEPVWPPTNDRLELERWLGRHPEPHNWVVRAGRASGVIAAELQLDVAREAFIHINAADRRWNTTLRFLSQNSWMFLFLPPAGLILNRNPLPGIRLHCAGNLVFVPPSVLSGRQLAYVNPSARLAEFPDIEAVLHSLSRQSSAEFED